ncbi:MAG: hypothetical protein IJT27_09700 [Clostridia bacterium]|nr:hypothetical protein [Clostridia bacterium]
MKMNMKKTVSILLICCLFAGMMILGACTGKKTADQEIATEETTAAEEVTADAQKEAEVPEDVTADAETAEEIGKVVNAFAEAVNAADWETVATLCVNGDEIVENMQKYSVTEFKADLDTLVQNPANENAYYCIASYEIDYNGQTAKDLGLGGYLHLEKTADGYKVSAVFTTGL